MTAVLTLREAAATMPARLAAGAAALADELTRAEAVTVIGDTPTRFPQVLRDIDAADACEREDERAELGRLLSLIQARPRNDCAALLIIGALITAHNGESITTLDECAGSIQADLNRHAEWDEALRAERDLAEKMTSAYF